MSDLLEAAAIAAGEHGFDSPGFYDAAMTGDGEPAMLPLERSPWKPVYDEAARMVPTTAKVVDLGCGTGRFLASLFQTSHRGQLAGVDFSPASIREARTYLRGMFDDEMEFLHRVTLDTRDLRSWQPGPDPAVYTCLEVLEHLDDDLDLIRRVPIGSQFVFSVPNYLSASHVRAFPSLGDVFARYSPLLDLRRWALVRFNDRNSIHVLDSIRRTDSW